MNYFDHNAIVQGRQRVRGAFLLETPYKLVASWRLPTLFMSADAVSTRRIEGGLLAMFGEYHPALRMTNPPR